MLFLTNNGFRTCFLLSGASKFPIDVASRSPAVVAPTTIAGSTTSSCLSSSTFNTKRGQIAFEVQKKCVPKMLCLLLKMPESPF